MKAWRLALAAVGVLAVSLGLAPAAASGPPAPAYSRAYLRQVESRMEHSAAWQHQVRGRLGIWGIDPSSGRLQVGLSTITAADRSLARRLFGGAMQLIIGGPVVIPPPVKARMATPDSPRVAGTGGIRDDDVSPFYGGGQVISTVPVTGQPGFYWVAECTTGFDAYNPSANWNVMLMAGHCDVGSEFTKWYSGHLASNGFTRNAYEGHMYISEFDNGLPDAGLLTKQAVQTYYPRVFYGQLTFKESHPVVGSAPPSVGAKIRVDGSVSGTATCGGKILHTGYSLKISDKDPITGKTITRTVQPVFIMSTTACKAGDSGGPIYYDTTSNNVVAAGTVEAIESGTGDCIGNDIGPSLSKLGSRIVLYSTSGRRGT